MLARKLSTPQDAAAARRMLLFIAIHVLAAVAPGWPC
jgi:hypothetical protein